MGIPTEYGDFKGLESEESTSHGEFKQAKTVIESANMVIHSDI